MNRSAPFIRLQLADDAKPALAREARRHGVSQTALASRLVEWVVRQPPVVQATVLNNIKNDMEDRLAEVLRGLSASRDVASDTTPARPAGRRRPSKTAAAR